MSSGLKTLLTINPGKNFNSYKEKCLSLLKNLSNQASITEGTILHGHLLKIGTSSDRFIAIKLLIMYLTTKKSPEAAEVMKDFNGFDLIAHNCMINANVQSGNLEEARKLFDEMPERNEVSYTALISGFLKIGKVQEAMWYFERNPFRNLVLWTATISGLVQNGLSFEGLKVFKRLLLESGVKPNEVTFTSVIRACSGLGDYRLGSSVSGMIIKSGFENYLSVSNSLITLCVRMGEIDLASRVFNQMEIRDVVSWTAILDMYVESGNLGKARTVFDEMPERNEVSWSAMIARYIQSGYPEEALKLFRRMVQEGFRPNKSCLSCVLSGLGTLKGLQTGSNLHGYVVKLGVNEDVFISTSLIDMYCKSGKTKEGRSVFDSIVEKNVVSWNSMVTGYSLNTQMEEANNLFQIMPTRNDVSWSAMIAGYYDNQLFDKVFESFNEMLSSGENPNKSTFASLLGACGSIASLEKGKVVHGKVVKLGMHYDVYIGTSLTDMYAKSGDIISSNSIFDRMPEKNEISWTVMIQALAENGFAEKALVLFEEMNRKSSVEPNELMLLSVLFACSHAGFVDKGLGYFNAMESVYGVKPKGRHYTCVVDLLSRSGRLSEAETFINSMPFQPEVNAWAALLSGCKTYKHEGITERVASKLAESAESNSAGYVLLSNIYASVGRWTDVLNTRKVMKEKGLKKCGGCSWIEVRNQVHSFYSEDGEHDKSDEIYGMLKLLKFEMRVR